MHSHLLDINLSTDVNAYQTFMSCHRRIADEYCGGAAVTNFPTKYFPIEFMRREFVVRVIGPLLVVLYLPYIY